MKASLAPPLPKKAKVDLISRTFLASGTCAFTFLLLLALISSLASTSLEGEEDLSLPVLGVHAR